MNTEMESAELQVVLEATSVNASVPDTTINVTVGEGAKIEVGEAITYIKSGQAEIKEAVSEVEAEITAHAEEKTAEFDANALNKTNAFNQNATDKTTAFNNNATSKTADFNTNASNKTSDFNTNATNKTTAFNENYTEKKGLIDAQVGAAEDYADLAKDWATKTDGTVDGTDYSAKYYAQSILPIASDITTVAGIASDVTTVSSISSDVTSVASNSTDISTVADSISDVNSVATDILKVTAVADDLTNIDAVNANKTNIDAVAGNNSNITAVANNATNINAVAGNESNINAVNANKTNIDTVASISPDVTTVSGISSDVTSVASNNTDISAVADDLANINAVNSNKTNIDAVAGDLTNINAVASDLTNIDNASSYANLAKDWATKTNGKVDGSEYSAKYYAEYTASMLSTKADKATTLAGYGITNAYTKTEVDSALSNKADKATTLAGYGITDAYTKTEVDTSLSGKQSTLTTAQLAAVNSGATTTNIGQIATNTSDIGTINGKIPSAASTSNQLADKSYVDTADNNLQSQIDAIVASSDVFDIVGTYAELQAYDISTVPVNDIIKVLVDSTHSNAATYYRCVESGGVKSWSYIGSEGAYYTKSETDTLLQAKQDEITSSNKLSADLVDDTSSTNKFVTSSDISTWNAKQNALTAGTGIDITSNVISVTSPTLTNKSTTTDCLTILGTATSSTQSTNVGDSSSVSSAYGTALGHHATVSADSPRSTVLGQYASSNGAFGIAIGSQSHTTARGAIQIGSGTNSTARSLQVGIAKATGSGSSDVNQYQLLDADGIIPDARISSNIARTSAIPAAQVNSDWNASSGVAQILNKPSLATVATSGSYNDLSNKPTIPDAQIQSDWAQSDNTKVDYIKNKPTLGTMAAESASDYTPTSGLATVATTGAYSDLSGTPTIPTVDQTYDSTSTNAQSGTAVASAISTKANVGLDNLNADGQMIIDSQNGTISNCILEIPQNIKLTIENNVLALKSGSVCTKPDGTQTQLTQDKTVTSNTNGKYLVISWSLNTLALRKIENCFSGSTAPTGFSGTAIWYDTTNNIIKESSDGGSTWAGNLYFPFAIITVSNGVISSIDQVFNGACYVGHHAFVYPNVKVLIPNGLNDDGSLKSIEYTTNSLKIVELRTTPYLGTYPRNVVIDINGNIDSVGYIKVNKISDVITQYSNYVRQYCYEDNQIYMYISNNLSHPIALGIISYDYDGTTVSNFTIHQPYEGARNLLTDDIEEEVATKQVDVTTLTGYDSTATQTLKNINGVLTWVTD